MHRHVTLLLRYGGRAFWVAIKTPDGPQISSPTDSLVTLFEQELNRYHQHFGRRVFQTPLLEDAYRVVGQELHTFPLYKATVPTKNDYLSDQDFWWAFLWGNITSWRHRDYLRAAYLMLVDPENDELGLLEVATQFATALNSLKRRNPQVQLQPVSRSVHIRHESCGCSI
jgi:hypothetical protein